MEYKVVSYFKTSQNTNTHKSTSLKNNLKNILSTYATVIKTMIHGPCGVVNPKAPCMVDGCCSKNFPKPFNETTYYNDDGYPEYMRRDNRRNVQVSINKKIIEVDNRWVVPYNPYLTKKYNCHINVEVLPR